MKWILIYKILKKKLLKLIKHQLCNKKNENKHENLLEFDKNYFLQFNQ